MKHAAFSGRLVILGFGSIGQGVLPLILRHIDMPRRAQITHRHRPTTRGAEVAAEYGVRCVVTPLTRDELPRRARPAAGPRRLPAQRLGRRVVASR